MIKKEKHALRLDAGATDRSMMIWIVLVVLVIGGTLAFYARRPKAAPPTTSSEHMVLLLSKASRIEPPFVKQEDATAAGGSAIAVPPKSGEDPGALEIPFEVLSKGRYNIWIRAYWGTDGEDACSNSIRIQLDEQRAVNVQDATYRTWHWLMVRFRPDPDSAIVLEKGKHKILMQNREDGIKLDQIVVTPWHEDEFDRLVPQGIL